MIKPMNFETEAQRLEELYRFEILDTPYEDEFNDIVKLASTICNTSISTISLIESSRQWFKAKIGLEDRETSRDVSFCAHAIAANTDLYQIEDATKTDLFSNNPLVTGSPNIRFYAGVPLVSSNGFSLGTLCVIDSNPKVLTAEQEFALKVLGTQVMKLLELRIMNKKLEQGKKRQQQQVELQNKIISIIAHDVRNPVASLKNIIELTNSNIITQEDAKELTGMAEKQLDGVLELLEDLLDWGKIQLNAQTAIRIETVHLYELVSDIFKRHEGVLFVKGNKLINLVDEDLFMHADINALRFILRNLIANANKFTSNGTISIYANQEEKKILITIQDTGVGMTAETIKKIMSENNHYTSLGTNNEKGTGLGIMLTKDFVDLMNGKIWIESKVEQGTSVYLAFNA
ncbi:MAG: GAF domain-containing sensor histidine kinase [Chitinophagaceae bacterium]|nr:GAF domain-containing sensor histidine kinase [Chitinophagaceae bacterium]